MDGAGKVKAGLLAASATGAKHIPLSDLFPLQQEQAQSRVHRPGVVPPIKVHHISIDEAGSIDQHMIDALKYGMGAKMQVLEKPLTEYHDVDMIMEMLRRGYAVMKLPADGKPPEVLRDK